MAQRNLTMLFGGAFAILLALLIGAVIEEQSEPSFSLATAPLVTTTR